MLDFISNLNQASVVTNTRTGAITTDPIIKTAPTPGNINIGVYAAKLMGVTDGDRVVIGEAPAMGSFPVTNPKTEESFIIYKGMLSNREALENQYDAKNNPAFASGSDAEKEYLAAREEWVNAQLEEQQLADNSSNGSLIRKTGNNFQFSSRTPWVKVGGTENGNASFEAVQYLGIAVLADESVVLITTENVDELGEVAGLAVVNPGNSDSPWMAVETVEEVKEATPFYTMNFIEFNEKASRTKSDKASDDAPEINVDDAVAEETVDASTESLEDVL